MLAQITVAAEDAEGPPASLHREVLTPDPASAQGVLRRPPPRETDWSNHHNSCRGCGSLRMTDHHPAARVRNAGWFPSAHPERRLDDHVAGHRIRDEAGGVRSLDDLASGRERGF